MLAMIEIPIEKARYVAIRTAIAGGKSIPQKLRFRPIARYSSEPTYCVVGSKRNGMPSASAPTVRMPSANLPVSTCAITVSSRACVGSQSAGRMTVYYNVVLPQEIAREYWQYILDLAKSGIAAPPSVTVEKASRERMLELGADPFAAMEPFRAPFDAFHARTRPAAGARESEKASGDGRAVPESRVRDADPDR